MNRCSRLLKTTVYFIAVYLPQSRLERGAKRAMRSVVKALDPSRELREAQTAYDDTPTAQNQMRLAAALLELGRADESARQYDSCLRGPFASDAEVRFGAARTYLACGRAAESLNLLQALQADRPDYRSEAVTLLLGRTQAQLGQHEAARQTLEQAEARFGSFESKAELAIWAYASGQVARANTLYGELESMTRRWSQATRNLNAEAWQRLQQARAAALKTPRQ